MAERKLAGHTQRNIRSSNLHVVLSMFRSSGTLTIRDITERTGLSKTAVSKIVNELLSRGLVLPAGKGTSTEGGGKRPDLFELSTKNTFANAFWWFNNTCNKYRKYSWRIRWYFWFQYPSASRKF